MNEPDHGSMRPARSERRTEVEAFRARLRRQVKA